MKILIKLNRIKPRNIKATIQNTYMWMGNIESEEDNLMLVDEQGDALGIPKLR